jgi:hypothetical protein
MAGIKRVLTSPGTGGFANMHTGIMAPEPS